MQELRSGSAPTPGSPRDRRRRATSTAISEAAVDLALERGLPALTVEAISDRAAISPRSFYNYFPTKELALLGPGPQRPDEAGVRRFLDARGDVLPGLIDLLADAALAQEEDQRLLERRRRLIRVEPALFDLELMRFQGFHQELAEVVVERLRRQGRTGAEVPADAAMIVALATAVMQQAFRRLVDEGPGSDPAEVVRDVVAAAHRVLGGARR